MTRKDFILIARVVQRNTSGSQRKYLAEVFAAELAATNPAFDEARFIAACIG